MSIGTLKMLQRNIVWKRQQVHINLRGASVIIGEAAIAIMGMKINI
jgi:hypothetical protein